MLRSRYFFSNIRYEQGITDHSKNQECLCEISKTGLKFLYTSPSVSSQGSVSIRKDAFEVWRLPSSNGFCFRINVRVLLQILGSYSLTSFSSVELKIRYSADENSLGLQIVEENVLSECKLTTLSPSEPEEEDDLEHIDFSAAFKCSPIVAQGEFSAEMLKDIYQDVIEFSNLVKSEEIAIKFSKNPASISLSQSNKSYDSSVEVDSGTSIERNAPSFFCTAEISANFRTVLFQGAMKGIYYASKSSLKLNEEGTLMIRHELGLIAGKHAQIDFYILPNVEE